MKKNRTTRNELLLIALLMIHEEKQETGSEKAPIAVAD